MTALDRDDEHVVSSMVPVWFSGEAVATEGKVAMTAAFVGSGQPSRGSSEFSASQGCRGAECALVGAACLVLGGRRVRRVGAPFRALAGLRRSPGVAAEATPWFNLEEVGGTLRPGWSRARKVPRGFVR